MSRYFVGSKRRLRGEFVFPSEITGFTLSHPSKGNFIADNMGDLAGPDSFQNVALNNYYNDMRQNGIVDDGIDKFISPSNTKRPYQQLFFVDLRSYRIDKEVTLTATTRFSGDNPCPNNLYLVLFTISEMALRKYGEVWTVT